MIKPKGIDSYLNEEWKELKFKNVSERHKYLISNYGRIVSYYYNEDGVLLKLSGIKGYKAHTLSDLNGKKIYVYIHRLVAEYFLDKPEPDQTVIIHIDNNRHNNNFRNLKWATEKEKFDFHMKRNPEHKRKFTTKGFRAYSKLSESDVKIIKRKLSNPKRKTKMKILARQFGVSEMQLYRIKSGENWSSVSVD